MPNDFYLMRKGKLLRRQKKMMKVAKPFLTSRYGHEIVAQVTAIAATEFERLIPEIPYIGGDRNQFTSLLIDMTAILALYQGLQQQNLPLPEIGDTVIAIAKANINRYPAWLPRLGGKLYLTHWWQRRTEKQARQSQKRKFIEDFVYEFVPGDGEAYAWGVNYLECAIVKFFAKQGATELTPYVCEIDFLLFPAMGIELKRTGTIGHGCTHCDFRFQKLS